MIEAGRDGWITLVQRIKNLDNGEKAKLKRNAGLLLEESRGCMLLTQKLIHGLVFPIVGVKKDLQENIVFMLSTTAALHNEVRANMDFGESLHALKTASESDSLDRKVMAIMDESIAMNPSVFFHRLTQLVRQMKGKDIGINWERMFQDVAMWEMPNKPIQKRWMRNYVKTQVEWHAEVPKEDNNVD